MYIYRILNTKTNREYIGQTVMEPRKRRDKHFQLLRKSTHYNSWLQNSFNKHKEELFKFEVLECIIVNNKEYLSEREKYYIINSKNCYNLNFKIETYYPKCSLYKYKCCPINLKRDTWKGRKHSEESKEKMRQSSLLYFKTHPPNFKGCTHSLETKEKMSLKAKDKYKDKPNPFKGVPLKQETKEKISLKAKERFIDPSKHPLYNSTVFLFEHKKTKEQLNLTQFDFHKFLEERDGYASRGNVSMLIKGNLKSYKGYAVKF